MNDEKKHPTLPLLISFCLLLGFIGGSTMLAYSNAWINGTNYIYPNESWSNNVRVTYLLSTTEIEASMGLTQHGRVPVIDTQSYYCDFVTAYATTMCYPNYFITAATGTPAKDSSLVARPGVLNFVSTVAANTGARINIDPLTFVLNGSETFNTGFKIYTTIPANNRSIIQAGFIDSTALQTESVDGVYFYVVNYELQGVIANNSARNRTTTNLTLLSNNWYDLRIVIDSNANSANFLVYNTSISSLIPPVLVYNQTITNTAIVGIPRTAARATGSGFSCGVTSAGYAAPICSIDYIITEIETQRRQGLMP